MTKRQVLVKSKKTTAYHICENCGWFRDINTEPTWKEEVIHHPVYGKITNIGAAMWDVKTHDCAKHLEVKERWNAIIGTPKTKGDS